MVAHLAPPFPEDVPTHPLLIIDYQLIKAHDKGEIDRLWEAATKLGFWYLKNHGADSEVNRMFEMGQETMALSTEEKMKFYQGDDGVSFGYKGIGTNTIDKNGTRDTAEQINIAKDDALSWPKSARRTYPSTVNDRMDSTIIPFVQKSLDVNRTVLGIFNERLGLPTGTLPNLHNPDGFSGCEARIIHIPPVSHEVKQSLSNHTDFGSLSFLHNRLGGLQVLVPGTDSWQYVKPIPGHAICNVGDALTILSGGVLRSNLHRVVPPPGEQRRLSRWSLVYFTRPTDSVVLRPLSEESAQIAEAVSRAPNKAFFKTGSTAGEWFARRVKNYKISNFKGAESWKASRGTEHVDE